MPPGIRDIYGMALLGPGTAMLIIGVGIMVPWEETLPPMASPSNWLNASPALGDSLGVLLLAVIILLLLNLGIWAMPHFLRRMH